MENIDSLLIEEQGMIAGAQGADGAVGPAGPHFSSQTPYYFGDTDLQQGILEASYYTHCCITDLGSRRTFFAYACNKNAVEFPYLTRVLDAMPTFAFVRATEATVHKDVVGYTVLHVCAYYGREAAIEFLLKRGVSAWSRNLSGQTPLHVSAEKMHVGSCR